jgi:N utilization substance protein A
VPDYQLSLAIGKEAQNVRLAAKLTGWRIDIRSDTAPVEPGAPDAGTRRPPAGPGGRPPHASRPPAAHRPR